MSRNVDPAMARGEFLVSHVSQPHLEIARSMQEVGYLAWRQALAETRTPEEILHVYNPDSQDHVEAQAESIRQKASDGLYVALAYAEGDETVLLGYAAAFNNLANSAWKRAVKKVRGDDPYMEISILNVHPAAQGKGHGSRLLLELTKPFAPQQIPTIYVFGENQRGMDFWQPRGFTFSPPKDVPEGSRDQPQKPKVLDEYFGEDSVAPEQWRLVQPDGVHGLQLELNRFAIAKDHAPATIRYVGQSVLNNSLQSTREQREA